MSAICNTSLGWIYGELMKKVKVPELLSDALFFLRIFSCKFHILVYLH